MASIQSHLPKLKYKCEHCPLSFATYKKLKRHNHKHSAAQPLLKVTYSKEFLFHEIISEGGMEGGR